MTEGYIGVSKNPKNRYYRHKSIDRNNPHLKNAFKKYDSIIQDILVIGEDQYCYKLEAKLRPTKDIGWNIAAGGEFPPIQTNPKSEEHKRKIRLSSKGKHNHYGEKNPFWGKHHTGDMKRFGNGTGKIPSNAISVLYEGKQYKSLDEASRQTGDSVYYIKKATRKGKYYEPATRATTKA